MKRRLTFIQGWLCKFNKRHDFKSHKSHGEEGDADAQETAAALPMLQALASQYAPCDIFNADEFGLNFTAASRQTPGPASLKGRKQSKERLAFLVCANVDGTEVIPPLMVGKTRQP